ncbi:C2 calcium-dependent domain-containing protein 4C-like [Zootoca vivipara]|uniref:C2 calcium-dependent domain-containing protein 4C-like n=1 Tax=Zootoca vivipara TaxID=8524 RepID=UPI0015917C04|nr:C2 calcium-dependent domain-containing protein 4C-like [Zootoca vivipara]
MQQQLCARGILKQFLGSGQPCKVLLISFNSSVGLLRSQLDSMWFLEKVGASPGEGSPLGPSFLGLPPSHPVKPGGPAAAFANILTPDRIPEFCIPPRLANPPPAKSPSAAFQPHRCLTEPGLQQAATSAGVGVDRTPSPFLLPHLIQVESVEEIPGLEEEEGTNSDPQSQAALSLPHFPKAQTSYGFCTLLESPHTRRKESIFHSDSSLSLALPRPRASSYGGRELPSSHSIAIQSVACQRHLLSRQGPWDSDTASSSESSPFSSPLLGRSPPLRGPGLLFKARSQEGLLGKAWRSQSKLSSMGRANSLSTEDSSSTDSSPNAIRRSSDSLFDPLTCRAYSLSPLPIFPLDVPCGGRERLGRESTVCMDKGGLLRLSSEYCPENRRLRVRLISVEGLYEPLAEPKSINCCITFSLVPGKTQKQRSTVIKRSRDPIFNEDFFFVGIAEDDLCSLAVRMKAVNKGCSLKRDLVLGESEVPLMKLLAG